MMMQCEPRSLLDLKTALHSWNQNITDMTEGNEFCTTVPQALTVSRGRGVI